MLSRIVIRSEQAYISIKTQAARLNSNPDRFELTLDGNVGNDQLQIDNQSADLSIDQTVSFASSGNNTVLGQLGEWQSRSLQIGLQKIASIASEGVQFLNIHQGGNAVAQQARAKGQKDVQVNIKAVKPPQVSVKPSPVNISVQNTPSLNSNWEYVEGESEYIPAEVVITLSGRPSIEITVEPGVELSFPAPSQGSGVYVDQAS